MNAHAHQFEYLDHPAMTDETDLSPLYVLRVNGEERATKQLDQAGITSWAPTYKHLKVAAGRQPARLIDRPLLPGYVFARLGADDFAAALATERVHGVISSSGAPMVFPEAEFTKVLTMAIMGKFDERLPSTKARPRGERKRGMAGLHAWFEAVAEASQLQTAGKAVISRIGGESVSDGPLDLSRRSTRGSSGPAGALTSRRRRKMPKIRKTTG